MNSKETLKKLVLQIKKATGLTQEKISVQAGYEPQSLTQMLSKANGHEAIIKRLHIVFANILNKSTTAAKADYTQHTFRNEPYETAPAVGDPDLYMGSIFNLTHSNALLAQANKKLADNNEELIHMVKSSTTANVPGKTPEAFPARFADLLEAIADVAGKKYKSSEEAYASLHKRFFGNHTNVVK